MKSLLYTAAASVVMLAACSGVDDFKSYVSDMRDQLERIDTISTRESYMAMTDSLTALNNDFVELGIDLNDEQKAELAALQDSLQKAIDAKYQQLMTVIPADVTLTDDARAAVTDGVVSDAIGE